MRLAPPDGQEVVQPRREQSPPPSFSPAGTEAAILDSHELNLTRRHLREELRPIREALVGLRQDVNALAEELRGVFFFFLF